MVRLRNNKITIRPIAGTRPRGNNAKKDKFYKKQLLNDKKELSEHLMLLDLGRNDVGKVSKVNSVKVTEKFVVEKYSHVMHIVSNVEGNFHKNQSMPVHQQEIDTDQNHFFVLQVFRWKYGIAFYLPHLDLN